MYFKQEPLDPNSSNSDCSMIIFDTEDTVYAPAFESNITPDQLDMNDFVDENIVNLFPELM